MSRDLERIRGATPIEPSPIKSIDLLMKSRITQAGGDLFYYGDGIYASSVDAALLELSSTHDPAAHAAASDLRLWEHTNHAVVAVGWGAERATGRKYWIAMNTWYAEISPRSRRDLAEMAACGEFSR